MFDKKHIAARHHIADKSANPGTINDWLRSDQQRNDLIQDLERLKQDLDHLHTTMYIGMFTLIVMLLMLLLVWLF